MLILSAGMQKSGSGYLYNIINDIGIASGKSDAREIKKRRHLEDVMQQHNNNIGPLQGRKLLRLWWISVRDDDFAVKTHAHPSTSLKILNSLAMVKTIYCYRDPRDVLLSAIDHGKKIQSKGHSHSFSHMVEFETALRNVQGWVEIWKQYAQMSRVLLIKYEDLMGNPVDTVNQIQAFLGLSLPPVTVEEILWKYARENPDADRTGMHFNKAVARRFETEMNENEKRRCREAFGDELALMGYSP